MIDKAAERGGDYFALDYHCAESVLLAVTEQWEIKSDLVPWISTGFCGGIARTCGMCGAVSGAIMCIGIAMKRNSIEDPDDDLYATVRELLALFEKKFGSINCAELTGCDLGMEKGYEKFETENISEKCGEFVREAIRLTLRLTG